MTLEICPQIKVFQKARSKSIKVSLKCNNYSQKQKNESLQIKSMPLAPQQEQMHKSEQEGEMTG